MPGARLMLNVPAATAAPVAPAHTSACARPSRDRPRGLHDRGLGRRRAALHGVRGLGDRDAARRRSRRRPAAHRARTAGPNSSTRAPCAGGDRRARGHLRGPEVGAVAVDRDHRRAAPAARRGGREAQPLASLPASRGRDRDRARAPPAPRSHGPRRCRRPGRPGADGAGCGTAGSVQRRACRSCAARAAWRCGCATAFSWGRPSACEG